MEAWLLSARRWEAGTAKKLAEGLGAGESRNHIVASRRDCPCRGSGSPEERRISTPSGM
jgi:hypothetical protein